MMVQRPVARIDDGSPHGIMGLRLSFSPEITFVVRRGRESR
jgi:hypothetical protein